jgi:glycosyltransferase involved in cell wall biosynthesis
MKAFIIMPDLPPNSGGAATAPGLRAFGLHQGFQSRGFDSRMLLTDDLLEPRRRSSAAEEPSLPPGLITVSRSELFDVARGAHDAVFVFNALNYVPVRRYLHPSCVLIADFIADLRLERPAAEATRWRRWRGRYRQYRWSRTYRRSLSDADIVTVNGRNKVATAQREVPALGHGDNVVVVPFSLDCRPLLPCHSAQRRAPSAGLRIFVGGFLQPWQRLGQWPAALARLLTDDATSKRLRCRVHLVPTAEHEDLVKVTSLSRFPNATVTTERIPFSRYLAELFDSDIVVDLHRPTIERNFAMSTRSVVALCAGLPIIHQRGTELSDLLVEYSAGFVVDPEDREQVEAVLLRLLQEPGALAVAQAGVRRLREAVLNPASAIDALIGQLNRR